MNNTTHDNFYNNLVDILKIELEKFQNENNSIIFDIDGTIIEKNNNFPNFDQFYI